MQKIKTISVEAIKKSELEFNQLKKQQDVKKPSKKEKKPIPKMRKSR